MRRGIAFSTGAALLVLSGIRLDDVSMRPVLAGRALAAFKLEYLGLMVQSIQSVTGRRAGIFLHRGCKVTRPAPASATANAARSLAAEPQRRRPGHSVQPTPRAHTLTARQAVSLRISSGRVLPGRTRQAALGSWPEREVASRARTRADQADVRSQCQQQ